MKISIIQGDLTKVKADAIVNSANTYLVRGSGVDGAIHNAAGSKLQDELNEIKRIRYPKGLPVGEAVKTNAYNLPSKIIIHTLGPRYYSEDINLLRNCYINSLKVAEDNNCKSIAFPSIGTRAHGVPIEKAVEIVKDVFKDYKSDIIEEVIFVLFDKNDLGIYEREIKSI
ncbi:[Protein ADP-ribosylglutamate] hydrolase [uncultured archaeon]|nr:[Protein ADP-ribosylglutamate] hydrolase [uncultured archaeon]